jgi:hypothetical protein
MRRKVIHKVKLQSAMEYLMTYGWAILIIAVVLGALFQMGVFNSSSSTLRVPPGACKVIRTSAAVNLVGQCSGILPQYVASISSTSSITVRAASVLEPSAVTISVWFFQSSYPGCYTQEGAGVPYTQGYLLLQPCTSDSGAGVVIGSGTEVYNKALSGNWPAGTWNQEAATFDGTNIALYANGKMVKSGASNAITYAGVTQFIISSASSTASMEANLQVYNTSIDSTQMQALYLEGIGGAPVDPSHIVGWWPLNGDTNDYSGNNNNGAPTSLTYISQYGK